MAYILRASLSTLLLVLTAHSNGPRNPRHVMMHSSRLSSGPRPAPTCSYRIIALLSFSDIRPYFHQIVWPPESPHTTSSTINPAWLDRLCGPASPHFCCSPPASAIPKYQGLSFGRTYFGIGVDCTCCRGSTCWRTERLLVCRLLQGALSHRHCQPSSPRVSRLTMYHPAHAANYLPRGDCHLQRDHVTDREYEYVVIPPTRLLRTYPHISRPPRMNLAHGRNAPFLR
ncbi:hypothetical protein HYPSUDRAFT_815873 [Hypholoma sublateritium FD-334 SS-4]|uniref:Secreted protein n=1 Tax=Hypholoma sublateritium (strain FD-334 SS-4) TaxID=945553 RepID=A0A0D2PK09_HYPSF|nr:hypothetical protein HYPSUDRAFT_815873 [Hypholoma sublateritium FD-334 SS-4]